MKEAAWAKSSSTKKSSIMNEATWAKSSSEEERLNQLRQGWPTGRSRSTGRSLRLSCSIALDFALN